MLINFSRIRSGIRAKAFYFAAALIAAGDFLIARLDHWPDPRWLEASVLFDLSILMPALYLWCHRAGGKPALIRAAALSCLGIWVAGHFIPHQLHDVIHSVSYVRYIGSGVLFVIELKLAFMIYRGVFRRDSDGTQTVLDAAKAAGIPSWAARIMAWEAAVSRRIWDAARRFAGRR